MTLEESSEKCSAFSAFADLVFHEKFEKGLLENLKKRKKKLSIENLEIHSILLRVALSLILIGDGLMAKQAQFTSVQTV